MFRSNLKQKKKNFNLNLPELIRSKRVTYNNRNLYFPRLLEKYTRRALCFSLKLQ